jgi:hypothetical protein
VIVALGFLHLLKNKIKKTEISLIQNQNSTKKAIPSEEKNWSGQ